jgi:hypothetical protein
MKTVWCVFEEINYHGDELWGIFQTEEAAEKFVEKHAVGDKADAFRIDEWEISGGREEE